MVTKASKQRHIQHCSQTVREVEPQFFFNKRPLLKIKMNSTAIHKKKKKGLL